MNRTHRAALAAALMGGAATPALSHIMQNAYSLPVPLWMYAYGATAALVASFVVVGYFVKAGSPLHDERAESGRKRSVVSWLAHPWLPRLLRLLSVFALVLCIATGFAGTSSATSNFNMTFFWVIFVLGFTYLTALIGDLYSHINPWRVLCDWVERLKPGSLRGRVPYPAWLGYYPALILYAAFIWLELFGRTLPRSLAIILLAYTLLNLVGAATFGISAWFRFGEFFGVFLRLVAKLAPVDISPDRDARGGLTVRFRAPLVGILESRPEHFSMILFVLFMLSSTAFDGVHETIAWVAIFWKHLYPILAMFIGTHSARPYLVLVNTFYYWQWLMLIASPFFYLGLYYFFVWLAKVVTGTDKPLRLLALSFVYSLIPIAFVYHMTHYFTLLISQAASIFSLLSDPFGIGWNLLGTKDLFTDAILLEAGVIWHTQVWLILIGHIVSVYLSHVEALRIFKTSRQATLSQLPLLVLMVALTTIGLWILSMPIAAGQVLEPPVTPG
jgi:hypothetical protein